MNESESKNEKPNEGRRFSQEQYDFLKECSEKGEEGIRKWNEWRKIHEKDDICLEGCEFPAWFLKGAELGVNQMIWEDTGERVYGEVYLDGADFGGADLRGTSSGSRCKFG